MLSPIRKQLLWLAVSVLGDSILLCPCLTSLFFAYRSSRSTPHVLVVMHCASYLTHHISLLRGGMVQ